MDKNKKHIDAEEFFKLLDADKDQDLSHLDDFDKEALEGLKMMKDHSKLNTLNTSIDEKLEELIADEKKGKNRTGLYFLSIAASIALVIGLFFVFKKSDVQSELALSKETSGKDMAPATGENFEKKALETNSDEQISNSVEEKNKAVPNKPLMESSKTNGPVYSYGSGAVTQNTEGAVPPPMPAEKDFDSKNISNGDQMLDDNEIKLENLKQKQDKIALAEEAKPIITQENSVAATSTGTTATYYNATSNTNVGSGTVVNGAADLSKTSTKNAEVKGKKKESKNYKSDESSPVFLDSKKETVVLTSPNVTFNKSNNNGNTNTNVNDGAAIVDNVTTVKTEDESGKLTAKVVEPEFVGGKVALDEYIKKNLIIPASCPSEEIVIVRFTIDAVGNVVKPKIVSKTGNCSDCEKEAIRFVKAMPAWLAGTADGKAFNTQKTLTLSFKK